MRQSTVVAVDGTFEVLTTKRSKRHESISDYTRSVGQYFIETNRFAALEKASKLLSPFSRINKWFDTDMTEMKQLFGLLIWTGLVGLPTYELYWSCSKIFANNFGYATADTKNRLYKLGTVLDDIMSNSNYCMQPLDKLCIDESLVTFMGRLSFKQYIKSKRDRFGIKEFKLCIPPCYTIAIKEILVLIVKEHYMWTDGTQVLN
eukprot:XP_008183155.1 PREDICTED: piggyBac transposable element-derived protein 4-like [Acyrthosiphon pisum]